MTIFQLLFPIVRDKTSRINLGNDPCTQALEQGQGSYSLQRWYWNAASQQCISFAYRGLKGTQNNFLTQQDCERTCHGNQLFNLYGYTSSI
uniref:BPTI/Kunitz inhibitor domain-containing protein n=1 Tax=Parascaris equorum TaxID=6256 RepID=A0A914RXC3_PAREQ